MENVMVIIIIIDSLSSNAVWKLISDTKYFTGMMPTIRALPNVFLVWHQPVHSYHPGIFPWRYAINTITTVPLKLPYV